MKPTPERFPGNAPLPACVGPFSILGAIGPMARTIRDVALLFQVLSGQDPIDPISPLSLIEGFPNRGEKLPIGYFEDDGLLPVTPETRQAVQAAAQALQKQGFDVRPFRPNGLEQARKLWWTFFVRCGGMFVDGLVRGHESELSPVLRGFLRIAHADPPLTGR